MECELGGGWPPPSCLEAISQQLHGEQASREDPGKFGDHKDENAVEVSFVAMHAAAIKSRFPKSHLFLFSAAGLFLGDPWNASSEEDDNDGSTPSSVEAISQQLHGEQALREDDGSCSVEQVTEEDTGNLGDHKDENAYEVDDELLQKDSSITAPDLMGDDNNRVEEIPDSKTEDYAMETSHNGEVGGIGEELEIGSETNSLVEEKLAELESRNKAEKKIDRLAKRN